MDWQVEQEPADVSHAKVPSWVITFADLMSLLMCFFVLLLSYSEMDAEKFKLMAASMQQSLGPAQAVPAGFGAGVSAMDLPLPIHATTLPAAAPSLEEPTSKRDPAVDDDTLAVQVIRQKLAGLVQETREDALRLSHTLAPQIQGGQLEIEARGRDIIVRLREKGSFDSGSAELSDDSRGLLAPVREVLIRKPGSILVQGHTDDRPIKTARFRSNWELSSVRAVAVAQELMQAGQVAQNRFEVTGLADTRPLVDNTSAENRSRNRRVEIVISQDLDTALSDEDKKLLNKQDGEKIMRQMEIQPRHNAPNLPQNIF